MAPKASFNPVETLPTFPLARNPPPKVSNKPAVIPVPPVSKSLEIEEPTPETMDSTPLPRSTAI